MTEEYYYMSTKIKRPKVSRRPCLVWRNDCYPDDDQDEFYYAWNDLLESLDKLMERKDMGEYFKVIVINFGWRNVSGFKYIHTDNAKELLRNVLPDTDCNFKIFNFRKGIAIQNYHHDSPTGNEWYIITPIKESTYYKENC